MPLNLWDLALFGEAPIAIQNVQCALDLAEVLVAVRERAQDVRTTTEPVGRLEGDERVPIATLLVEVLSGDEHLSRARILLTSPLRHGGSRQNHAQQESGNHSSQGFSRPSRSTSDQSPPPAAGAAFVGAGAAFVGAGAGADLAGAAAVLLAGLGAGAGFGATAGGAAGVACTGAGFTAGAGADTGGEGGSAGAACTAGAGGVTAGDST